MWCSTSAAAALLFGIVAFATAGCTVTLIAPYDDATVNAVTELLKKTDTFLLEMASDLDTPDRQADAAYEKHRAFYDEISVSLSVIRVRAEAIPKNERTVAQLGALEDAFAKLEDQHKKGFSKEYVVLARRIIDQAIGAILAAEFAKKRE